MCFSLPSLPSVHFLAHVRHPLSLPLPSTTHRRPRPFAGRADIIVTRCARPAPHSLRDPLLVGLDGPMVNRNSISHLIHHRSTRTSYAAPKKSHHTTRSRGFALSKSSLPCLLPSPSRDPIFEAIAEFGSKAIPLQVSSDYDFYGRMPYSGTMCEANHF